MHSYDLICLSKTWLDPTISTDCQDLVMQGVNFYQVDKPDDAKKEAFASTKNKC